MRGVPGGPGQRAARLMSALTTPAAPYVVLGAALSRPEARGRAGARVVAVILATSAANHVLKRTVRRRRPPLVIEGLDLVVALPRDGSMPSGHTARAFAVATVVASGRPDAARALAGAAAILGWSRVRLGVHWPSDVAVGAVMGVAVGLALSPGHHEAALFGSGRRPPGR